MQPVTADTDLLTAADYSATADGRRYQLVEGELIGMAPASNRHHQDIAGKIYRLISDHAERFQLGRAYIAPCDVFLGPHDVFQPDVLFVSSARSAILTEDGIRGAPDLVVEVVSPATAQLDKTTKRRVYARTGVKEMWLVDPLLRLIHLYDFARDTAKAVRFVEDNESFESPLLPGLIVAAAEVLKQ